MQAGISTACLYPMLLEKSLETLLSLNFRLFEVFINTCSELRPEYLRRLRRMANEHNAVIRSVHPFTSGYEGFLLFSDYERRFLDGLDFYKRYFEACGVLGARILVLHGKKNDRRAKIPDEAYFERYCRLFDLGKSFGVTVAQENVNQCLSDDPEFIRSMKLFCGTGCAFVLDVKQAVRGGVNPYVMCETMGSRLVHVHLNDNDASSDCLLPGVGTMDFPALISILRHNQFTGDLLIEVYRKSFGAIEELSSAKRSVEDLLEKLRQKS
jgi:sugar phosphate isomerase/epimerase